MFEVSDRTLLVLTAIALITTVGGTLTILQRLGPDLPLITGFAATDTGIVNVTVDSVVSITLSPSVMEFGNGALSGSGLTQVNSSAGITNPSTFEEPGDFQIENDGNVDVNLTINGTPASVWIGGTDPTYRLRSANPGSDDGCVKNKTNNDTAISLNATQVDFCLNLTFSDAADTINVSIFLGIPSDVAAGTLTDNSVTVFATQAISAVE